MGLAVASGSDAMAGNIRGPAVIVNHSLAMSSILEKVDTVTMHSETSYFSYPAHRGLISAHIILMVLAWVFVLPVCVMFGIARSRLLVWSQVAFAALNGVGLFIGMLYNANTPDLYENDLHSRFGWAITALIGAQAFLSMVGAFAPAKKCAVLPEFHLKNKRACENEDISRPSHDSGQGTEPPSPGAASPFIASSARNSMGYDLDFEDVVFAQGNPPQVKSGAHRVDRALAWLAVIDPHGRLLHAIRLFCDIVDRIALPLGFVALSSGIAVYGGHFKGHEIFSGLAHFVKGGIFFWNGLLVLGRFMGSFADLGWSWNVRPGASMVGRRKAIAPTPEFAESLLIFVYGSINMFLEHLGSEDGSWSATDLEHVSISVLFAGGGLLGMMLESTRVLQLLNSVLANGSTHTGSMSHMWHPQPRSVSLNPIPAIIIMLLGKLMSSHHQASMTSTMLHSQWGNLFAVAACARGVTYLLMFLAPPTSHLPSRPPSEVVVAFSFISGGLLFMGSNSDFVTGMEMYNLNAMFLFTVVMGLTSFLMAWETIVLAAKAWAVRREL